MTFVSIVVTFDFYQTSSTYMLTILYRLFFDREMTLNSEKHINRRDQGTVSSLADPTDDSRCKAELRPFQSLGSRIIARMGVK